MIISLKNNMENHSRSSWKNDLVLIAKNTFVWLYQLSKDYNRKITALDQVPDEEFIKLKEFGINAIWLIGIWERSCASKKIKQLYGFENVTASAYSIFEYKITESLGGRGSFIKFRERAHAHGFKLGCDMVPNHTGLDSPWLAEHPQWYIAADQNPSQNFTFRSPDLSLNDSVEIRIEDRYYSQTGAAEVFLYKEKHSGKERYLYHGNDGTSMPWNDTAQLNYLVPEVREKVRETICNVAADFDIIRLDAAMTLTKNHYKRLWFPGDDGERCIPTREDNHMSQDLFDQRMPREFWVDVMDDIKTHRPDTLMLAEAFWLMEGYFIKKIGMDRVYNSAFMHMMKNEENKKFKNSLRGMTSITDNALEHLINYQTTPDEEPAIYKFGKDHKYFCVCTLLCTLPGLPMFGHGQLVGYRERYGMDYRVPHLQESQDQDLVKMHKKLISPILRHRSLFSTVENFKMHDLIQPDRSINQDVILFTNGRQDQYALVVANNSSQSVIGHIPIDELPISMDDCSLQSIIPQHDSGVKHQIAKNHTQVRFEISPYACGVFLL